MREGTITKLRDLRWVALSWLDSFLLAMLMWTMDIPALPFLVLGLASAFFFLTGLAQLLVPERPPDWPDTPRQGGAG